MSSQRTRREFIRDMGISAAAAPFLFNLSSPSFAKESNPLRRKRLIVMFSPNGIVPKNFWPDEKGSNFTFKESLKPLESLKDRTLIIHGLDSKIRGDGDNHMRGIGCLMTGAELFPGNIQGGSHTPAGWSSGISIDQEIKNKLQKDPQTRTRFGSLEFGVLVRDRADTWTRMSYAGPNQPLAPIDDPYQIFSKLYGQMKDRESLKSILDDLKADLKKLRKELSKEDQHLLDEHAQRVREMEKELQMDTKLVGHAVPELDPGIEEKNENMPRISKMNIDLLVSAFAADFARVSTFQFTHAVGNARMKWLGVDEGHHSLSHKPDSDKDAQDKLTRINKWYAEQLAYMANKLASAPEPGGQGSLLDNTTIIWTNELGKGNSHTLSNIPFVCVGDGLGFKMGRSLKLRRVPHNRFLMSLAHSFDHKIESFGNPIFCRGGALDLS